MNSSKHLSSPCKFRWVLIGVQCLATGVAVLSCGCRKEAPPVTRHYQKADLDDFVVIGSYEGSLPVIGCGDAREWDQHIRESGNVLYEPNDAARAYKMFYSGYQGPYRENNVYVGYAYSSDSRHWIKYGRIIHDHPLEDPYVVKTQGVYYLYAEDKIAAPYGAIRRYHSTDVETWTDDGRITGIENGQSPVSWVEEATWYMLYEHFPVRPHDIRLATSRDGLHWSAHADNPVFSGADTNWATGAVVCNDIIKRGAIYYMFYHGMRRQNPEAGMAMSCDRVHWRDSRHSPFGSREAGLVRVMHVQVGEDPNVFFLYWPRDNRGTDDNGIYRGYPMTERRT